MKFKGQGQINICGVEYMNFWGVLGGGGGGGVRAPPQKPVSAPGLAWSQLSTLAVRMSWEVHAVNFQCFTLGFTCLRIHVHPFGFQGSGRVN